jgi:hypothetical protein
VWRRSVYGSYSNETTIDLDANKKPLGCEHRAALGIGGSALGTPVAREVARSLIGNGSGHFKIGAGHVFNLLNYDIHKAAMMANAVN